MEEVEVIVVQSNEAPVTLQKKAPTAIVKLVTYEDVSRFYNKHRSFHSAVHSITGLFVLRNWRENLFFLGGTFLVIWFLGNLIYRGASVQMAVPGLNSPAGARSPYINTNFFEGGK